MQSLGAVDGPGLRCVVFMQGCPLRCVYCHNPDTWERFGGEKISVEELTQKVLRFRPYMIKGGGVTVSGGEPLLQGEFVAGFFKEMERHGIHTALDTSGAGNLDIADKVLDHTALVLADLKFSTAEDYQRYANGSLEHTKKFLALTAKRNIPLWIRHVVIPGITDSPQHLAKIQEIANQFPNLQKIEWLPFHNLCIEKYQALGIAFPLEATPSMNQAQLHQCLERSGIALHTQA